MKVVRGIPQGSTLRPLLFSLYLNDLPLVTNSHTKLFADDTAIIIEDTNLSDLLEKVTKELAITDDKRKFNRQSLNYFGTTYFEIGNNALLSNRNLHVKIDKHLIPSSKVVKYLGIQLNYKLKWEDHVELVVKKL